MSEKISTQGYKGTRDFYPPDEALQQYIFDTMRMTVELFGYEAYNASLIEATDLYRAKSGQEIVDEQTYSFTDRGGRDVTIRPEMTPTVARMIAAKRNELSFPLRWYSIPNVFRYERPQRGRLREHWQLNVDIFGVDEIDAEIEMITLARDVMRNFGAEDDTYVIKINHRGLVHTMLHEHFGLDTSIAQAAAKLIDKKDKMEAVVFHEKLTELVGSVAQDLEDVLGADTVDALPETVQQHQAAQTLATVFTAMQKNGVHNVVFDLSLMRGFDYYTGIVFEVFDTHPDNNRSLFGGGRYDNLVGMFGVEPVSGVGFGMGDVTIRDYLETYDLLPAYEPATQIHVCVLDTESVQFARDIAAELRDAGIAVALNTVLKKPAQHIKTAEKQSVPYIMFVGENELKTGQLEIKELQSHETISVSRKEIVPAVLKQLHHAHD